MGIHRYAARNGLHLPVVDYNGVKAACPSIEFAEGDMGRPYKLYRKRVGEPYAVDLGGERYRFLEEARRTCGLCFNIDDRDVETLWFYEGGFYTYLQHKLREVDRSD
ncbi:hypothetical protein FOZ60_014699 [Perkinsus olseni]|uniref:Uncharacterized protein n=1 Tax=Perkinsus olseni TaxID=32597 RepID=A0A7J6TE00_PEROL|nr:hypothetical protein FOZ60_014699 [Perkinsus olseni]KAF4743131.1 hypothetical protein FOZ62_031022 [Perkinsus olseni]